MLRHGDLLIPPVDHLLAVCAISCDNMALSWISQARILILFIPYAGQDIILVYLAIYHERVSGKETTYYTRDHLLSKLYRSSVQTLTSTGMVNNYYKHIIT